MEREKLGVGALLQQTWAAASAAPAATLGFIAVMSAFGIYIDTHFAESPGFLFLDTLANFVASFFLMTAILRAVGLRREGGGGGFGAYFVVSFLGGLGILLGFVLLIIPGVVLMVRWSAAIAIALSEDGDGSGALSESWQLTEGQFWPILAAMLIGVVPLIVVAAFMSTGLALADPSYLEGAPSIWETVMLNVIISTYSVFSTGLGIAVYWVLSDDRRGLSEVFA